VRVGNIKIGNIKIGNIKIGKIKIVFSEIVVYVLKSKLVRQGQVVCFFVYLDVWIFVRVHKVVLCWHFLFKQIQRVSVGAVSLLLEMIRVTLTT
jgi:hypothetical protein